MPAFSTIAIAALAAAGIGAGIHQGEAAKRQQKRALEQQAKAQRTAEGRAAASQRRADAEFRRANRRQPDISSLLTGAQGPASRGPAGTLLTGATGVDPNRLRLGRSSLLGG